jgi:threonine dehydratase
LQIERGATFVHPFDDPAVIAGQGTLALEILRQHPGPLQAVFVPVGGGGLLAGVATCIKALRPEVQVIGVQADDADAMACSLETGARVTLDEVGLFADGTAVKQVGALTFALCRQHVNAMLRVDTDAICAAIRDIYQDTRSVPEPSGALALAGLKQYVAKHGSGDGALVAIVSGANMNFDRLRFVAERAEVGEQREAVFAVTIPEERGSFRRFCATLGQRSITEFNYRIGDASSAHIFVGVQISGRSEREALVAAFHSQQFSVLDLTDDELAKLHLRHMVGGRSALARTRTGISACFTTATTAPTTVASWSASRYPMRSRRCCVASWPPLATRMSTTASIRHIACCWVERLTRNKATTG